MTQEPEDDLLDRLVNEYADRLAQGRIEVDDLLAAAPAAQRAALERCFRMMQTGRTTAGGARAILPGTRLGPFRIESLLGRGGMANVYRATQVELQRTVALKVLRPGLALDAKHVARFQREALAIAR